MSAARTSRPLLAVALVLALTPQALAAQEEWPGFRGADGSAVAHVALDVSTLAPEVVWRVQAGSGYSGIVVADGRVITMIEDGAQFILALDAETGAELWRHEVAKAYPGHDGSWDGPVGTPVVHDGVVVALEPWGRLVALDAVGGEPMWSIHLADDLGAPRPVYGFASSPTVVGDTLIINGGGEAGTVIGFGLRTGEQRWKVGAETAAAQSPVLVNLGGRDLVVAAGGQSVFAIEPTDGTVVMQYAHGGRGVRGSDSMVPVAAGTDRLFLTHSGDSSQAITVATGDGGLVGEQLWDERTLRSSYVPTVFHDGYIYGYNLRILSCVDAATGELMWRSRTPGDGFPTIIDGYLMVLTKDGTLHLAPATPDGYDEMVGVPIFNELTWTPPSVAYGDVFARSQTKIARIDLNGAGTRAIAESDRKVTRSLDPGAGEFGRFVRSVETAADPTAVIDEFFAQPRDYPIHEGDSRVHFVYRGEATDMAITGDMLGTRQDVTMARVGDTDLYYYTAELLPEARLSYAFLHDGEMITDPLNPVIVPTMIYNREREHVFGDQQLPMSELHMPGWRLPDHLREPDPASRGTVETIAAPQFRGNDLEMQVYLPQGYAESSDRYAVVYYHGPSATELSLIPTTLDNLIADGMQPVIAIWAGARLGAGGAYSRYWAEEIVPLVDARYRTRANGEGRVSTGGGMGALAALQVAVDYPDMTSGLAILSIRALDRHWDPLLPRFGTAATHPRRVYVDWGVYGVRNPQEVWDNRVKTAQRAEQLRELGYEVAGGAVLDGVGWASWRNHADAMLKAILPATAQD